MAKAVKAAWPKTLPAQIAAVREALEDLGEADAETVARTFAGGRAKSVEPLLENARRPRHGRNDRGWPPCRLTAAS